jgi:hypothetical protein
MPPSGSIALSDYMAANPGAVLETVVILRPPPPTGWNGDVSSSVGLPSEYRQFARAKG